MRLRMVLILVFIFLPIKLFATSGYYEECYYETADGVKTSVYAKISREVNEPIFNYYYALKSNPESTQNVWVFEIILPAQSIIISASSPTEWEEPGWSGKQTKYSYKRTVTPPYLISWPAPEGRDIQPSESVKGFTFKTSFGLPGIVDYYVEGDAPTPKCPEGMAVDSIPGYDDLTPYGPGIVGKTLGPTAPPADFKPIDFLNYIISLKHEAYNLGWIIQGRDDDKGKHDDEEKGIMKSLDKKLEKAREELVKGDTRETIEKLKSFIHEVEALYKEGKEKEEKHKKEEGHSHITSEAYALLKYNTIYLIEKLGGVIKEKD